MLHNYYYVYSPQITPIKSTKNMWSKIASFVLKFKLPLIIITLFISIFAGYFALKVPLSYDFTKAVPESHPAYITYNAFKSKFGNDGNVLAIGIQTDSFFNLNVFNSYRKLHADLKKLNAVEAVISIPTTLGMDLFRELDFYPDSPAVKAYPFFADTIKTQAGLDSARKLFEAEGLYKGLLYNPTTKCYNIAIRINKDTLVSNARANIIANIETLGNAFGAKHNIAMHYSGLPLIRTKVATLIQGEMRTLLLVSLALSVIMLLLFFRSLSNTILSLVIVLSGVTCSLGLMYALGYKITILTALLPPLIIIIGIPNCIYFINKYHTAWLQTSNKNAALHKTIASMGIVTLMCNVTAAIGFAVFALTDSALLKEFGIVSGIAIMLVFLLSFILVPTVLAYLPTPKKWQLSYLNNKLLTKLIHTITYLVNTKPNTIIVASLLITIAAGIGLKNLKQRAFIVDELPKNNIILKDLKYFETHFKGVMPLEIIIESKNKKNSLKNPAKALPLLQKIDSLSTFLAAKSYMGKPLSIVEGMKFMMQAYNFGADSSYILPQEGSADLALIEPYLSYRKPIDSTKPKDENQGIEKIMASLVDSSKQFLRISVSMKDIGTQALPLVIDTIQNKLNLLFADTANYKTTITGSSVTFNEGSRFIISGLKESILWAFGLIAFCMLLLFKNFKILVCSLIPNILPLIITAGVMGYAGVNLKPSTVLVFSVVLGIAIDITIRFLVNYKQQLPHFNNNISSTVNATIKQTGISIIYTAIVLVAGFGVFISSGFGGTFNLGWLTALTLVVATITNLLLLPVLLNKFFKNKG